MELIGKQIAIETILGQPPELHYPSWYAAQIEKLPPAPPEYLAEQAGILVTDADTISRQAVLDALNNIEIPRNASWYQYYQQALTAVDKLPPAQPEIIRCKDCKHFKQVFAPNDNDGLCGHWHSKCDARINRNGYCSHAERKEVTT